MPARRDGPDRLRLRPHGGRLRPRHRGAGDRRAARPARPSGGRPPGTDPRFVRWCATCCVERAAVERGERRRAGRRRRLAAPAGTVCPRRLLPQPARRPPPGACGGPGAGRDRDDRPPELLDLALDTAREAGRAGRAGAAPTGSTVAGTKSSDVDVVTEADRACEELIRDRLLGGPPRRRRSSARRAATSPGTTGRALDRRPDRRHRELPLRPAAVRRVDRRRARRRGGGRGGARRGHRRRVRRHARRRRDLRRRPLRVRGPSYRWRERLVGTGFSYEPPARAVQAAAVARLLPRVRDIRRLGSCALDLCQVAEGRLDAYVEEGVHLWDHAAGGAGRRRGRRRRCELTRAPGGKRLLICAPAHGFAEFRRPSSTECRVRRWRGSRDRGRAPAADAPGNSRPSPYCS